MRKILILIALLSASVAAFSQETSQFFLAESTHYRVYSESSQSEADSLSRMMEACLQLYNDVFHFDLSTLAVKPRVRMFRSAASFNAHLTKILSQTRSDFVYVSYSDPEKSELLCFPKGEGDFTASLIHQGCVQYFKTFIANPPIWLREGIATYLEAALYNAQSGTFQLKPNFAWLDWLKKTLRKESGATLIPLAELRNLSREAAQTRLDAFFPQAWGLVEFLMNSSYKEYNRVLWDAISSLDPKATLEENSLRVDKRAFEWVIDAQLSDDFEDHILSLMTAPDLLRDGIERYTKGELKEAEGSLRAALELKPDNATVYYYLGLIAYARKDYPAAEDQYLISFQLGMNTGLINYAMGVNAFAAGKNDVASKYLLFAKQADSAAYGEKVDSLLKRIGSAK